MADVAPPLPRVVLMGLRRSGKTSIQKVVFERTPPHETTFLQSTAKIQRTRVETSPFVQFQIWDLVGQVDYTIEGTSATGASGAPDLSSVLENCGAVVFVLDCRVAMASPDPFKVHDFEQGTRRLVDTIVAVQHLNPAISVEIFLHKVDALSEPVQMDLRRKVKNYVVEGVTARLGQQAAGGGAASGGNNSNSKLGHFGAAGGGGGGVHSSSAGAMASSSHVFVKVAYHLTSIFDHSVFEAFSHVVQKLMPQLSHVQSLLDMYVSNSGIARSFLFDVSSKIYVARDTRPYDRNLYELCSDAVDLMKEFGQLYDHNDGPPRPGGDARASATTPTTTTTHQQPQGAALATTLDGGSSTAAATSSSSLEAMPAAVRSEEYIEVVLQDNVMLYLRSVCRSLTLVSVGPRDAFERGRPFIDFNISVFHRALVDMFGRALE